MRVVFPNHMSGRFLDDLASEMNTFVETIFGEDGTKCPAASKAFTPRMDVDETETGYTITMDLPGVNPADVNIDMEDEQLVIQGARERGESVEGTEHRRVERAFGEFHRVVKLSKLVDKEAITANYDNGVLTIVMPKLVETKTSRRIVISQAAKPEKPAE